MARDYLAIPGSGVSVERLFSHGPDLLSHRRQRLTDESIRMCLCLNNWISRGVSGNIGALKDGVNAKMLGEIG
jgi:hypothetical protein